MAFSNLMLTTSGKTLFAKAQQGKTLNFTRAAVGDGDIGSGSLINRTALLNETMSLSIDAIQLTDDGSTATVVVQISNAELSEGFYFRELGIFAQDPDTLEEKLYVYDNASTDGEYLPAASEGVVVEEYLKLILSVDGASSVTIENSGNPVYVIRDEVGAAGGVASLDESGQVPAEQLGNVNLSGIGLVENADGALSSICYAQNRIIIGEMATFNLGGLSPDGLKFLYGTAGSAVVYFRNTTWDADTDSLSITLPGAINQLIVMNGIALGIQSTTGTVYAITVTESGLELLNTTTGLSFNTLSTLASGIGVKDCINYLLFVAYLNPSDNAKVFKVSKATGVASQVCVIDGVSNVKVHFFLPYGDDVIISTVTWTNETNSGAKKILRITSDGTVTTIKNINTSVYREVLYRAVFTGRSCAIM